MNYEIKDECNYFFESLFLITSIVNEVTPRIIKDTIVEKFRERGNIEQYQAKLDAMYDPLIELSEHIQANVDFSGKYTELLFKRYDVLELPLVAVLLENFSESDKVTMDTYREFSQAQDGSFVMNSFIKYFNEYKNGVRLQNDRDLFLYIYDKNLSGEIKNNLILIYLKFEEIFTFMVKIATQVESLLREKYNLVQEAVACSVSSMRDMIAVSGFSEFFRQNDIPVSFNYNKDYVIYPTLFPSNNITMYFNSSYKKYCLYWGINIINVMAMNKAEPYSKEKLLEVLKMASDKTKFEILILVRREALYGSQIAEKLSLTSATISHHLSQLVSQGLIRVEDREMNKIFFKLDKEMLGTYIDEFKRLFE